MRPAKRLTARAVTRFVDAQFSRTASRGRAATPVGQVGDSQTHASSVAEPSTLSSPGRPSARRWAGAGTHRRLGLRGLSSSGMAAHPERCVGQHVVGAPEARLRLGVELLSSLPSAMLGALKVRSGEHLAALTLSGLLMARPISVDESGGVDLVFDVEPDASLGHQRPGLLAVEVKSLPGEFREFHARSERGLTHSLEVTSVDDLISVLGEWVERAESKLADLAASSRHAFLVVHPLDHLPVEIAEEHLISPFLPELGAAVRLDAVWLLYGRQLAIWTRQPARWSEILFVPNQDGSGGDDDPWDVAEESLLARLGLQPVDSPFMFGLTPTRRSRFS